MMPTQEEIDIALAYSDSQYGRNFAVSHTATLAAAYRAEKERADKNSEAVDGVVSQWKLAEARAELAERQYSELSDEWQDPPFCAVMARHAAERRALASQAVDEASEPRNDADASGDLPAR
jgi:hypothetical protein